MLGHNKLPLTILNVCIREEKKEKKITVNSKDSEEKFEGLKKKIQRRGTYCVKSTSQMYLYVGD